MLPRCWSRSFPKSASPALHSYRPHVESLEVRTLLSASALDLAAVANAYQADVAVGAPFQPTSPLVQVAGNNVLIDATFNGNAALAIPALQSLGMVPTGVFGSMVSGWLPVTQLSLLPSVPGLRAAMADPRPEFLAANVSTMGAKSVGADLAQTQLGVDGTGVTIGVLSDSFNALNGYANDVAKGVLPANVNVLNDDPSPGNTDEGRAMLQVIHAVAPGASLDFASATGGQAAMAQRILNLKNAGCQVIVDDTCYLSEPMFQEGVIAQAVDQVVASGITYISAAGNNGSNSYADTFRNGGFYAAGSFSSSLFRGGYAQNFDSTGGNVMQSLTLAANSSTPVSLGWDSPSASAGGAGSPNSVDVYELDASGTTVLQAFTFNAVGGDAVNVLDLTNTTAGAVNVNLMIVAQAGPLPGYVKYILHENGSNAVTVNDFATNSSTVFGHANVPGVIAVGTVSASSTGGTPILFDTSGNRLPSPSAANTPQISGPDNVPTTVPDFTSFQGTSAAAADVTGVAALLVEAAGGTLSSASVLAALKKTASKSGPLGVAITSGLGFVQAVPAVEQVNGVYAVGAEAGGQSIVKVYSTASNVLEYQFMAFAPTFMGGVRVAVGDVNGDGVPDIICASGPGAGPIIEVIDGKTRQLTAAFYGMDPSFFGGIYVACADINRDGHADIIVGAGPGGGPEVAVFNGGDYRMIRAFYAFPAPFRGGVTLAVGDVNGDGCPDIIVGAGPGAGPQVNVFSGRDFGLIRSFYAFPPTFRGGVFVAAGDINGDGHADIIVGAGEGGLPEVNIFDGATTHLSAIFFAVDPNYQTPDHRPRTSGVHVGFTGEPGAGRIITGTGVNLSPLVEVYDASTLNLLDSFYAFDVLFAGGISVSS
jgi:hypothetical protein